jgi:hypothetical protein
MILATLVPLALKLWPAVAGAAGAVYFASQGQPDQAVQVLLTGLGLSHVLHQTTPKTP